jgi:hypothetical protein
MALKQRAYRQAKSLVGRAGFDLTRRHFYSPIPHEIPEEVWDRRGPLRAVKLDLDGQLAWLKEHVAPTASEFTPPIALSPDYTFVYSNGSFGNGDADVLYGLVRSLKPQRIVELGSGHTSAVIHMALNANHALDGASTEYVAYDPFPTGILNGALPLKPVPAERVPDAVFEQLGDGDVLFVDTTHTVKIASDVVRIVLDALPLLRPGVLVHFHDVFLPYEYPRSFFTEHEFYWAEQYLLQAFLAFNDVFEVKAALHALFRDRSQQLASTIPAVALGGWPGSFWLQRR